jgi:hypothetical protein
LSNGTGTVASVALIRPMSVVWTTGTCLTSGAKWTRSETNVAEVALATMVDIWGNALEDAQRPDAGNQGRMQS